MQPFFGAGTRVTLGAALALGAVLTIEITTRSHGAADPGTAYAIQATPQATPTAVGDFSAPSSVAAPVPTPQLVNDQIRLVAEQVAQIAQDPSIPVDAKTTQINALASQFNELVIQWQQQTGAPVVADPRAMCGMACARPTLGPGTQPAPVASATLTVPAPVASATLTVPTTGATAAPSATNGLAAPPSVTSAEQLRAQIADVVQQMTRVAQDASLSTEAKTAQLGSLSDRFNQLTAQLRQQGG